MFKLVLEEAEESEIKLPTSTGSSKKQESSRKTSISALLTTSLMCESQQTVENSEKQCCESAALNMSANLENTAVATGLEKVSFHSSP